MTVNEFIQIKKQDKVFLDNELYICASVDSYDFGDAEWIIEIELVKVDDGTIIRRFPRIIETFDCYYDKFNILERMALPFERNVHAA